MTVVVAELVYTARIGDLEAARLAHVAYIDELEAAGTVRLAGRFTDGRGGLLVLEVEDEQTARALFDADPYQLAGAYERVELRELFVLRNTWLGGHVDRP